MNKTRMAGHIKNGQIIWFGMSADGAKRHRSFLSNNEGKRIEATIELDDSIETKIHRFYRGYLLKDIACAMGERNEDKVHFLLKKEFFFKRYEDLSEVPNKYKHRCVFIFDQQDNFKGIIPSMADMTNDEAKEYLLKCEERLYIDLEGHLGMSSSNYKEEQENAHEARNKIFNATQR